MLGIYYLLWHYVAAHMSAVLLSVILHAVLWTTQPLQPLHSPAPDWSHTSQHNNNNQTHQLIPSPLGAWLYTRVYPACAPRHTLSLCIPHWLKMDAIHYWPMHYIQGAQYININSNISIRVTNNCPNTTSAILQLHQLAPLHKSIHHAQDHSLTILQDTIKNCLHFCTVAEPPLRSALHLPLGLAWVD